MSRSYRLHQRAAQMDETRRRITEAAVELHGTVGPANTTVSAIAERAGVQRLTVYRHFPDEQALFAACSAHWLAHNPPPPAERWAAVAGGPARLARALDELYAYYEHTATMWERVLRDAPQVPALREPMEQWATYLVRARDVLVAAWGVRGRRREPLTVSVAHSIDFTTWASLARHGATRATAVRLMVELATAAAATRGRSG
jgi:AcrR family transcriptional regulator